MNTENENIKSELNEDSEAVKVERVVMPPPQTKHNLIFEVAEWRLGNELGINDDWLLFRIGTCEGQWRGTDKRFYEILSIKNSEPGNGHFDDVLEWFEYSCRRDGRALLIREIMNQKFYKHLIEKRGFNNYGKEGVIKIFKAV